MSWNETDKVDELVGNIVKNRYYPKLKPQCMTVTKIIATLNERPTS